LPAPFSPQMAWIAPARTQMETSARALTPGNSLVMQRISKIVWLADIAVPSLDANYGPWCAHKLDLFAMPDGDFATRNVAFDP